MKKTIILYSTRDGQTKKIARFIAEQLGHNTIVQSITETVDLNDFDQIVVGASIRYGHFNAELYKFIEKQTALLNQKQTAFFGVNLTARKAGKDTPKLTYMYVNFYNVFSGGQPKLRCLPVRFFIRVIIGLIE